MTQTEIIIWSLAIAGGLACMKALGMFKRSFREPLTGSLDANYTRRGMLLWDLTISAKGASVGIKQGRFLLPVAMARASLVRQGKATII